MKLPLIIGIAWHCLNYLFKNVQLNQKFLFICYTVHWLRCKDCPFAHATCLWSAVIMFIWLTDGWCASLSAIYTYMKSIYYEIKYMWRRHSTLVESKRRHTALMSSCCRSVFLKIITAPTILHLLDRTTLHHHHFVKFKHHVHWDHRQTKIGCMSNTECFDKWL